MSDIRPPYHRSTFLSGNRFCLSSGHHLRCGWVVVFNDVFLRRHHLCRRLGCCVLQRFRVCVGKGGGCCSSFMGSIEFRYVVVFRFVPNLVRLLSIKPPVSMLSLLHLVVYSDLPSLPTQSHTCLIAGKVL
jgi:hypothetical protein